MDAHDRSESLVREWGDSLTDRVGASAVGRRTVERHLWVVAVLALVADVHLTYVGLQLGYPEGNPVMRLAIAAGGVWGLAAGKLAVLGIAVLVRALYPRFGPVIPLGLAVPWATAAALNAVTVS